MLRTAGRQRPDRSTIGKSDRRRDYPMSTPSPDQPADELLGDALLVSERLQLVDQPLRMDPTCVRQSPGKENGYYLKPFVALQRVRLPPGKGAARQPEASLAWVAVTPLVKRRQRIPKPEVLPRLRTLAPAALSAASAAASVCGAKPGANIERQRVDPQSISEKRLISATTVAQAGVCCTCVPGVLPRLPASALSL
jgi:hypothetical protein